MQQKLEIIVKDNKYGLINQQQEIIVPCIYDDIKHTMNNDINYEYFEESEKGFSILKLICEFKFQMVEIDAIETWLAVKQNNQWGFLNYKGELVVDCIYDDINILKKDYSIVQKGYQYQFIYYLDNELIYSDFYDDIIAVVDKHISYDNTELFPYLVVQVDNKKSIIHIDSKTMTSTFYDDIIYLYNDYFSVKQDGKYAVMDIKNNVFTPFIYDEIIWLFDNLLKVKQANKYGIINEQGAVIIPILYDDIDIANEQNNDGGVKSSYIVATLSSYIVATLNGKIGYFNRQGRLVKPFTSLESVEENTSLEGVPIVLWVILAFVLSIILISLLIK